MMTLAFGLNDVQPLDGMKSGISVACNTDSVWVSSSVLSRGNIAFFKTFTGFWNSKRFRKSQSRRAHDLLESSHDARSGSSFQVSSFLNQMFSMQWHLWRWYIKKH